MGPLYLLPYIFVLSVGISSLILSSDTSLENIHVIIIYTCALNQKPLYLATGTMDGKIIWSFNFNSI
jgi:hypothetical protein